MKKSIIISLFALLFSVASFAQDAGQKIAERKAPSVEQIAKRRADMQRKTLGLNDGQYQKLYKLYLKQAKQQKARMEQMKKEQAKTKDQLKKIFTEEQWAKYEKMQKRAKFNRGKQIRRPGNPAQPFRPTPRPAIQKEGIKKGPTIDRPQNRKNNMVIEKK
ncbi:MAG: hypothetical protein IKM12_02100 [Alistipes sp.]|nr:hypothetical protein [Alistipes sp.]